MTTWSFREDERKCIFLFYSICLKVGGATGISLSMNYTGPHPPPPQFWVYTSILNLHIRLTLHSKSIKFNCFCDFFHYRYYFHVSPAESPRHVTPGLRVPQVGNHWSIVIKSLLSTLGKKCKDLHDFF